MHEVITNNIELWTSALLSKSTAGRGSNGKVEGYGIKKLRELILELAVRGKLVPQDENDEPASVLLRKIAEERDRLAKEGKVKKPKELSEIKDNEQPFELPMGWQWVRLGELLERISNGYSGKQNKDGRGFPLSRIETISNSVIDLDKVGYSSEIDTEKLDYYRLLPGDILLSHINSDFHIGKTAIVPKDIELYHGVNLLLLRLISGISPWYVDLALNTLRLSGYFIRIAQHAIGQASINQQKVVEVAIALPPANEQHRIVAKVDELMALCDQLEQQQTHSIEAHQTLVETLLGTLTRVESQQELSEAWTRIANHFDTLFTTENSVESLKQTILELAVMGKLSSPQKSDTPIEALLDAISIERRQLGMTTKEAERFEAEYHAAKKGIVNKRINLKARFFCGFITKGTTPSSHELLPDGDVPFLKVYNIVNNRLDFGYKPIFISNNVHQTKLKRSVIYPGDVIMNIVGPPLGKVAVVTEEYPEWNMNQALAVFRPLGGINNKYIHYMLTSGRVLKSALSEVKGTAGQDNLSLEQCRDLLIPIPSLEEQHRIVARVDELMALSDALRARLVKAQITQIHLADAIVEQELA